MSKLLRPLLGASAALVPAVGWLLVSPTALVIEHVAFEGQARSKASELRHLADVRNGERLWAVDVEHVARSVERHPWVRQATAWRSWPGTLNVQVVEHVPVALLHRPDGLYYVADDGIVFGRAPADDLDHVHLTGPIDSLGVMHPDLPDAAVHEALDLIVELDAGGRIGRERISEIAWSSAGLVVIADATRLRFAHGDLARQLRHLDELLAHGAFSVGAPVVVDLGSPDVAIVTPVAPPFPARGSRG